MQKQKEKQKQKPRQVEFTEEIIAAHVEAKAQKRAPAEKWLQSFRREFYLLQLLPGEAEAEAEAQKQRAREAAAGIGTNAET